MNVTIRQEAPADYSQVFDVVEQAFRDLDISDHREQFLVERLRNSDAFVPELSIVAEYENQIIGHILLTKIRIKNEQESFESLALAPVSVKPGFQKKGVGWRLIIKAHKQAKVLGFKSVVVLGHPDYYPKFGYEPVRKYYIQLPFDAPADHCMAFALVENGLAGVSGMVEYPQAFFM